MKYILTILISATFAFQGLAQQLKANRYLYVAAPGIRDYLGYGGTWDFSFRYGPWT
jgi:hypothetical protein